MSGEYRIHGVEISPYSVKVRSYFRYKGIPHRWIPRNQDQQGEYQKYAKLPLVPLVVTPDEEAIQDSTPIIERVDADFPEPSIHPNDPVANFISILLEEFGDEWGNKWIGLPPEKRRENELESVTERRRTHAGKSIQ